MGLANAKTLIRLTGIQANKDSGEIKMFKTDHNANSEIKSRVKWLQNRELWLFLLSKEAKLLI